MASIVKSSSLVKTSISQDQQIARGVRGVNTNGDAAFLDARGVTVFSDAKMKSG